jgi:hypothetical protein
MARVTCSIAISGSPSSILAKPLDSHVHEAVEKLTGSDDGNSKASIATTAFCPKPNALLAAATDRKGHVPSTLTWNRENGVAGLLAREPK